MTLTLNIILFLANHQTKDLLHFITCGNVDVRKSSFTERILYDGHHVLCDQMSVLQKDSSVYGTNRWRSRFGSADRGLEAKESEKLS
jgi:sulfate adenylyltransferase subunit 1 (EFTu-like GTPase family)